MKIFARSYSFARAVVVLLLSLPAIQQTPAAPWVNTGGLNLARNSHTTTLLPNGQLLIAGGILNTGVTTNSVELYDPASGTCKLTGTMTLPRRNHTAILLLNGKVLVTGGVNGNQVLPDAELYNPATGLWTSTTAMGT